MLSSDRCTTGLLWAVFLIILASPLTPVCAQEEGKADLEAWIREMEQMRLDYENRISDLELTLELQAETRTSNESLPRTPSAPTDRIDQLGQTDRFSRTFNPAIGVVLDTLGSLNTDRVSGHGQDRFWFRAAELSLAAHIDPFGYAYAVIEGSEGESLEVVEAAAVMNRLPWNLSIKGGRLLADVTKLGQRHDHELPFVEKPGSLNEFIGGSLRGTGVEVHQWFGLTDTIPVRWSVGMYSELEGHGHALGSEHAHAHDHSSQSKRRLDNFHYTGRLTTCLDLDEENSLQLGSSVWWAPETVTEEDDERFKTHRAVGAVDLTYKWQDPASQRSFTLGGEGLVSNGTFFHEEESGGVTQHMLLDEEAIGGYLWCEYAWNPYWSAGLLGDAYAHVEHPDLGERSYSSFLTWRISKFNWVRLQYRFNDRERGHGFSGNDYHEVMLQWAIVIGSHGHGLDW